jgi:RNA polymerase I-specific transcription initiation factor RRN3
MQFARVAQSTGFIYCYSILESNKRMEYTSSRLDGSASRDQRLGDHAATPGTPFNAELNTFFPFDPYMLPKSNSYIQGVYREWSSVAIDDDVDEDAEEEGEGDDDDHDETRHEHCLDIQRPEVVNSNGLTASLDAMSISR